MPGFWNGEDGRCGVGVGTLFPGQARWPHPLPNPPGLSHSLLLLYLFYQKVTHVPSHLPSFGGPDLTVVLCASGHRACFNARGLGQIPTSIKSVLQHLRLPGPSPRAAGHHCNQPHVPTAQAGS